MRPARLWPGTGGFRGGFEFDCEGCVYLARVSGSSWGAGVRLAVRVGAVRRLGRGALRVVPGVLALDHCSRMSGTGMGLRDSNGGGTPVARVACLFGCYRWSLGFFSVLDIIFCWAPEILFVPPGRLLAFVSGAALT